MASLALRAVRRCRRLASAPGAARLVFVSKFIIPNLSLLLGLVPFKKLVMVAWSKVKLKLWTKGEH